MKTDKLTKLLLILIIALFIAVLARPIFTPTDACSKKVPEYKTLSSRFFGDYDLNKKAEKALNKAAAEGWRLHSVTPDGYIVFER